MVSFPRMLRAENRLMVSVEIRWRFKPKPGEIYIIHLKFAELVSEEFHARLQKDGQITVPIEIVEGEALSKGDVMKVRIQVRDE